MMATNRDDVEQLLADTWTDELAAHLAGQVAGPGDHGYLVRAVQPDAADDLVRYVHELIAEVLARETGVDLDWARRDSSWSALDQIFELLREQWADGGTLPSVPARHRDEAHRLLTEQLTGKAAEWAGCDVADMDAPPVPLVAGGHLRVDLEGLGRYLATFAGYGVHPDEPAAIHRLHEITEPAA